MATITLAVATLVAASALAGPLTPPPGPPAPTNTTLRQIEPRIDIATVPSGSSALHRITQPGSYYLSSNITYGVSGNAIIEVVADDVTIDLQGFRLDGLFATESGIRFAGSTREGVTIANGSFRRFAGAAIDGIASRNTTVSKVSVRDSDVAFLFPNGPTNLTDCHAFNCGEQVNFFAAFVVFNGGTLTRCIAEAGSASGFSLDTVTIRDSIARNNTDRGFTGSRINAIGCIAFRNGDGFDLGQISTAENCIAHDNDGDGFIGNSVFRGCFASFNGDDGFVVAEGGVATQCRSHRNEGDGFSGTYFTATDCVAQSNTEWGFNSGGVASIIATNCYGLFNDTGGFRGGNYDSFTNCHVINFTNGARQGFVSSNDSTAVDCTVNTTTSGNAFNFGSRATIDRCTIAGAALRGILTGSHSTVTNTTVSGTDGDGIVTGAYSTITDCRVTGAGSNGINASSHTIIEGCVVNANNGIGIDADANSVVIASIAENNAGNGIDADDNSIVRDSVASGNGGNGFRGDQATTFVNCTAASNTNFGFEVGVASAIRDCTARVNTIANFSIANDCLITGCHSDGSDIGIITNSTDNTIDSNTIVDAVVTGIVVNGSGNLIIRNKVSGTNIPIDLVAGNNASTFTNAPSAAGPWDNFAF